MCLFQGRISSMFEGWFGERKTQFNLWFSLNKELYRRFHDVIIPSDNGTTQVDHVLVSPFGLFIVETKNLKGWIYGSESQPKWTQVVYKNKYSFQNPLKQTYRQKKVLSKFLDLNENGLCDNCPGQPGYNNNLPSEFDFNNPEKDIYLEDGDRIHIPNRVNAVTVVGDVYSPGTIPFSNSKPLNQYIAQAGGLKPSADKDQIYMVLPNGEARAIKSGIWRLKKQYISPGSTIFIPKQTKPFDWLEATTIVTPIISNLATTAAALAAIND